LTQVPKEKLLSGLRSGASGSHVYKSVNARDVRLDRTNVSAKVLAVASRILVWAGRKQVIVAAIAAVEIHELHRADAGREVVGQRPFRGTEVKRRDDCIVSELVACKACIQTGERD